MWKVLSFLSLFLWRIIIYLCNHITTVIWISAEMINLSQFKYKTVMTNYIKYKNYKFIFF